MNLGKEFANIRSIKWSGESLFYEKIYRLVCADFYIFI